MTEKILILDRRENTFEIQDENNEFSFSYLQNITHVEKDESEYGTKNKCFNILNGGISAGFVTKVKEIKGLW